MCNEQEKKDSINHKDWYFPTWIRIIAGPKCQFFPVSCHVEQECLFMFAKTVELMDLIAE